MRSSHSPPTPPPSRFHQNSPPLPPFPEQEYPNEADIAEGVDPTRDEEEAYEASQQQEEEGEEEEEGDDGEEDED